MIANNLILAPLHLLTTLFMCSLATHYLHKLSTHTDLIPGIKAICNKPNVSLLKYIPNIILS